MLELLYKYINEVINFFIELAPYFILGLFVVGILKNFIKQEFIKKHLANNDLKTIVKSSIIGVPLPLCSCSVLPTAKYFKNNGASNSAVTSFLISTPTTGIDSILLSYGMMGPLFGIYRPIASFVSGLFGGYAIKLLGEDKKVEREYIKEKKEKLKPSILIKNTLYYGFVEFVDELSINLIIGVLIASLISTFFPKELFESFLFTNLFISYIVMIILGLPMYVCATTSIPIALAFITKGVSPGAAFVFLTAGPISNIAAWLIVKEIIGKKNFIIYIVYVFISSILSGYILDLLFNVLNYPLPIQNNIDHEHNAFKFSAFVLLFLLLASIYRLKIKPIFNNEYKNLSKIKVKGMSCSRCENSIIEQAKTEGIDIKASAIKGYVYFDAKDNLNIIKDSILKAGYKINE